VKYSKGSIIRYTVYWNGVTEKFLLDLLQEKKKPGGIRRIVRSMEVNRRRIVLRATEINEKSV